jgi:CHAD domain-containing protein
MMQLIGNRLVQAILRQAGKVSYFCAAENIPANQTVHELRRSFKRLRALLRFFRDVPDTSTVLIENEIRNFGRLLAPLRESAVNVDLFDKEVSGNKLIPERKIRNARDKLVRKNKQFMEKGFVGNNLHHTIHFYFTHFESALTANGNELPSKGQLCREVSDSYAKSYRIFHDLPANPHPEEWHELRKKLKRLWYQLDFIRFLHPRYFKMKTDQLNKITDQLGDDHDYHVFSEDLKAEGYGFDPEELQILENQIEHLRELNQLKLMPRLKQFFAAPPGEFDQKLERFFKLND